MLLAKLRRWMLSLPLSPSAQAPQITHGNHPRSTPCYPNFPVLSSPTATVEVVGNTGNPASEKPDFASSGGFLINFIRRNLAKCDRKNQTKSPTAITHDSMMWPTVCRRGEKLKEGVSEDQHGETSPADFWTGITSGLPLALIGNASGQTFAWKGIRSEAFSTGG